MSTTLLDTSAGSTQGVQSPFKISMSEAGPIGVSVRVTTGASDLDKLPSARPRLYITPSNFSDGPTTAADIQAELSGGGVVETAIEVGQDANDVRYTEFSFIASGPELYGYLYFPEALSADVDVEIEAVEL